MKKSFLSALLCILSVTLVMSLAGCGSSGTSTPATTTSTVKTTASSTKPVSATSSTAAATSPAAASGDKALDELLSKAAAISVQFEFRIPNSSAMKVWQKGKKIRFENASMVEYADLDENVRYSRNKSNDFFVRNDLTKNPGEVTSIPSVDLTMLIRAGYPLKISGKETIDGKDCTIVQWSQLGITMQYWVWNEKGVPLKAKVSSGSDATAVTAEYVNYDFSDFPDNIVKLPADAKVVEEK